MTRTGKALALSAVAGLLMANHAWAQDPAQLAKVPPSVRAGIQTEVMAEKLHLSPQEKTQVEAVNLKYANQMQPVLEGSSGMFARMREAKRVEGAKDAEMKTVLSPAQYEAYLGLKSELRERLKQKALEGGAGAP
jgi:hypothetical protein